MPRAKIETAFLGSYTVAALDAAPDAEAAWLVHALALGFFATNSRRKSRRPMRPRGQSSAPKAKPSTNA